MECSCRHAAPQASAANKKSLIAANERVFISWSDQPIRSAVLGSRPLSDLPCPICREAPRSVERVALRDELSYTCGRCGQFRISGLRADTLPKPIRTSSHADFVEALRVHIRRKNILNETPVIDSLFIDDALSTILPD